MVKIEKELLKDGSVRWRARGVTVSRDPATGKRRQVTITGKTKREVERDVSRITGQVADGTYTPRWDGTVVEVVDGYLRSAAFEREANTVLSYTKALLPVRERLGNRKARGITRQDIEDLRDWMLTSGRRRGGRPGTPLGSRSVRLTLGRLSAAFELACQDGRLAANPCRYVRLPSQAKREGTTWSDAQLRTFIKAVATDRLHAVWLLSLLGLRRGEVLGLKWSDVSFTDGTLTIARARVLVDGKVHQKSPKSRRSWRVLPLFEPVTGALEALYKAQVAEKEAAGAAYGGDVDSGYIAADELGRPLHPETYSDEFARLRTAAGLPGIRLHDTRGTMNGILEKLGVPHSLRAAWLGHTVAVNRASYLDVPRPEDLAVVGDTIGRIFRAA
jgi:integrase